MSTTASMVGAGKIATAGVAENPEASKIAHEFYSRHAGASPAAINSAFVEFVRNRNLPGVLVKQVQNILSSKYSLSTVAGALNFDNNYLEQPSTIPASSSFGTGPAAQYSYQGAQPSEEYVREGLSYSDDLRHGARGGVAGGSPYGETGDQSLTAAVSSGDAAVNKKKKKPVSDTALGVPNSVASRGPAGGRGISNPGTTGYMVVPSGGEPFETNESGKVYVIRNTNNKFDLVFEKSKSTHSIGNAFNAISFRLNSMSVPSLPRRLSEWVTGAKSGQYLVYDVNDNSAIVVDKDGFVRNA